MWRLSTSPSISNAQYSHRKRYSNMQKSSKEALESINHELLQSILVARVMWRLSTSPSISNAQYSHRKRYSNMQKSSKEALESINHELLQSILYENNLPSKKKKKPKRVACCRRSVRKTERNCRRWESSGEVKKWGRLGWVGSGEEHYATRPKLPSFFHSFATITPFTIALRFNK